jgi:aminoglycoside 3-N-acetyltransferase I
MGSLNNRVGVRRLGGADVGAMRALSALFAEAFEDQKHYSANPPDDAWLRRQLADPRTIVLIADEAGIMTGGLVAYELPKLEQARSEIYIYDLAVASEHRQKGVATTLINALRDIAKDCGAWVMFVQADYGDDPAIALYTKLGRREDVMHFDIGLDDS